MYERIIHSSCGRMLSRKVDIMNINNFKIGKIYTNSEISTIFKVSLMRGMARSNKETGTDSLVLISKHVADSKKRNPYEDKWIEGKLHYTGEGKEGDQSIDKGQNKTLARSSNDTVTVYLFEVFEQGEYIYRGIVELRDEPYEVNELDVKGKIRKVWKFPLTLVKEDNTIDERIIQKTQNKKEKLISKLDKKEVERLAKEASKSNKKTYKYSNGDNKSYREVTSKSFDRNPYIAQYVKDIARGYCALCEEKAPFKDKLGQPFLHSHHINYLSKGGEDTIENCIAVCPNCHAKIHTLEIREDKEKLLKKISERV